MFSRAAKSIAKTISQRKYHVGDENIKLAMVGGSGGISRSFSQMLKRTSKLDVLTLYDVAALNKRFLSIPKRLHSFDVGEPINPEKSRLFSALENLESSKEYRSGAVQEPTNIAQKETQELIDSLRRLPIAEECAADRLMENNLRPQGHKNPYAIDQRGPRVLGEMGPDNFRHNGRIVSEINRQFPEFISNLSKNHSANRNTARRHYSNAAFVFDENRKIEQESRFNRPANLVASAREKSSPAMKSNFNSENLDKKHLKKKKGEVLHEKANKTVPKQAEERVSVNIDQDRLVTASKLAKNKIRAKTTEPKPRNTFSASTKSKNWTVPAILSDKKPKMLYGLVQHRRRSLSWFFTKFFDVQPDDASNSAQNIKCGAKVDKTNRIPSQKSKQVNRVEKLNASTSMSDLTPHTAETGSSSPNVELRDSEPVQATNHEVAKEKSVSSIAESIEEYDPSGDPDQYRQETKVSSRIAEFLENLRTNRCKLRSSSSLTSYNLDSLFTVKELPVSSARFLSHDSKDSAYWLKHIVCRNVCNRKGSEDDICKKRRPCKASKDTCSRKKESSCKKSDPCSKKCGSGDADPCKPAKPKSCRKKQDPCKKRKKQETCAPACKREEEDPCKQLWREDVYGKSCKEMKDCDPCAKFKKKEKSDYCGERRESSCAKTAKKAESDASPKKAKSDTPPRKMKSDFGTKKPKKKKKRKSEPDTDKCPPVTRAPGCPDDGKSKGNRKFSTTAFVRS
ncbi:uncharacterized protein LOC100880064 isoform X2 [Megachile rotundata]|uniref:uncharacterized protein LOC100880064 isoform X2 n=1 Tax=Megachile rotundata TaxID=143995 RepID=UPI003FCF48D7